MQISVLYFAAAKDAAGLAEESLSPPGDTVIVSALADLLCSLHPQLSLDGVRFAVNEEFVRTDHVVRSGDTVAVIPPVSGG